MRCAYPTLPMGLSPRVRGNPPMRRTLLGYMGSIPACAGEPSSVSASMLSIGVYPRVCGGTINFERPDGSFYGLSPRVRGNRNLR